MEHHEAGPWSEGTIRRAVLDRANLQHFPDPKPAYVADWDQLPEWQQETDADIFERIEQDL